MELEARMGVRRWHIAILWVLVNAAIDTQTKTENVSQEAKIRTG